jgi:hypothetical protein
MLGMHNPCHRPLYASNVFSGHALLHAMSAAYMDVWLFPSWFTKCRAWALSSLL